MRLPNVAHTYQYSLSLLVISWCLLVEFNAKSKGFNPSEIEDKLFGKDHSGRQWRRRRRGQLTEADEFRLVAEEAGRLGWIDDELNTLFIDSYVRRYSEPPTDESESDADIMRICDMYQSHSDNSEELMGAYNRLLWYAHGPEQDDPTWATWVEIHQQVISLINYNIVFDEIENHLLEMLEITSENKLFNGLTGNIEGILKKLRKTNRISRV